MYIKHIVPILFIVVMWWSIWSALDKFSMDMHDNYKLNYYLIYGITFILSVFIMLNNSNMCYL